MKVLIADDDIDSRHILEKLLKKWGYEVIISDNGIDALKILKSEDSAKIAILDWMMPGMDGIEVCRTIREMRAGSYVYIILLTAKTHKEDVMVGMDAGADDYIVKPFDSRELKVRLQAGKRIIQLQQELVAAQETLREQATHDSLTGLFNRRAILDLMKNEIARAKREKAPMGVIMVDIDHFKNVNDTYGHIVGDQILKASAPRMSLALRQYDYIGRYGGEEFIIITTNCDLNEATKIAERLRTSISDTSFQTTSGKIDITISLGVFSNNLDKDTDIDSLIRTADDLLYKAKTAGRNRMIISDKIL